MNKTFFRSAALSLVCALALNLGAQELPQMPPLPIDPAVRCGQLDNGLTYYIRHNEQPKQRCEFHIAQAVGAILEEDNQNGLAHFLEHMAFNGTEHFPGKGIINYFESIGVNFGGNINAYTSLDETVYRLSAVPTYREGIVDSALLVLHDWSCAISLLGEEIDDERGVIREEWRTGATANRRMWKESNKQKYPGSQYAKRDVIGDTAIINNFSYDALRAYYKKWYGPDLQAIVVVGDIDVDAVEKKIKALWADVPARTNRGERPLYGYGENTEPIVSIVSDKEAEVSRMELEWKHEAMPANFRLSQMGYVMGLINGLVGRVISYRFDEMKQDPNSSFIQAYGAYQTAATKKDDVFTLLTIPKEGQEKDALKDLMLTAEKLKRFGITDSELERAKADLLNDLEKSYNDRNSQKNITLTREYIRNFLDQEVIPGIEWEYNTAKALLPQLSLQVINQVVPQYMTDENLIISIMGPEKVGVQLPTKEEAIAYLAEAKNAKIDAPKEEKLDQPLVDKKPRTAQIRIEKKNPSLGTTEWTLSNGARVVIKPTTFKQDEILLNAYSHGGLSKIATADLPSATLMTDIIENNGLGKFSSTQLQKLLTGKTVSISPSIDEDSESLLGNSSVKDFEAMLQLAYLYFTAPRQDDAAYQSLMSMLQTALANKESNSKAIFSDSIKTTQSGHSKREMIFTPDLLNKISQTKALELFAQRFSNPNDFIFMFTGNINPDDAAVRKAICTWIGGIKGGKVIEKYTDNGERTPRGEVKNYFTRKMTTHTASNYIIYTADMPYILANRQNMSILGKILSTRYLESIREREGGSYGVGVYGFMKEVPVPQARLLMQFDTDPLKQEKLMGIIHQELRTIAENGPRADDLAKTKESLLKDFSENQEKNEYWSNSILYRYYIDGINYTEEYAKSIQNVSAETIQNIAQKMLESGNVIEVVMSPE